MSAGEFWPETGIQTCDWVLAHRQNAPFGLSGGSVAVDHGEPYWTIDVAVSAPRHSDLARSWSAFMRRRGGRRVTFSANRVFQSFPANGSITSDSGLSVSAIDRAASTVTFSGTNSALSQASDMIGYFTADSGFYVGEIKEALGSSVYSVTPPPFDPHASTANPRRIKALGEFRMNGDFSPKETYERWSLNFTASQVIRG